MPEKNGSDDPEEDFTERITDSGNGIDGGNGADRDGSYAVKRDLQRTFDEISDEFSETRSYPWKTVEEFLDDRQDHRALDLACGNGRHLLQLEETHKEVVGIDFSINLLTSDLHSSVPDLDAELVCGDVGSLPFSSNVFDTVLYVAGLHHLPSRRDRIESLNEVSRVLSPGGECLVSVWAIEHGRFDGLRDQIRRNGHDFHVPWKSKDGESYDRYYHIYGREGFVAETEESDLSVHRIWLESGNYYAVLSS
ncbi:MAG: class I SAM-dependent methyltransferase [Halobacteria archaeon]